MNNTTNRILTTKETEIVRSYMDESNILPSFSQNALAEFDMVADCSIYDLTEWLNERIGDVDNYIALTDSKKKELHEIYLSILSKMHEENFDGIIEEAYLYAMKEFAACRKEFGETYKAAREYLGIDVKSAEFDVAQILNESMSISVPIEEVEMGFNIENYDLISNVYDMYLRLKLAEKMIGKTICLSDVSKEDGNEIKEQEGRRRILTAQEAQYVCIAIDEGLGCEADIEEKGFASFWVCSPDDIKNFNASDISHEDLIRHVGEMVWTYKSDPIANRDNMDNERLSALESALAKITEENHLQIVTEAFGYAVDHFNEKRREEKRIGQSLKKIREDLKIDINTAIKDLGYLPIKEFEDGEFLEERNVVHVAYVAYIDLQIAKMELQQAKSESILVNADNMILN